MTQSSVTTCRVSGRGFLLPLLLTALGCAANSPEMDGGADAQVFRDSGREDVMVVPMDAGEDAGTPEDGSMDVDGGPVDAGPRPDGGPLPRTCVEVAGSTHGDSWSDTNGSASVSVAGRGSCQRSYALSTTATLRDALPESPRTVMERVGQPTVRSGHDYFDALHALALDEVEQLSVDAIRDYAFNEGASVGCGTGGCFETGRKWNYVWTRDTAYAVDLGLAAISPERARNSLEFKLSEQRGGGNLQIVQDTGSGGSYPVSSDQVSWAMGARTLLAHLDGTDRETFAARALEAIANTIEQDRVAVFDAGDGLYRGEQSFLDWREQTYAAWTATDVVDIAMSKSLGTNLLHLNAIELAAELAEASADASAATRYTGWATQLRAAIQAGFWIEEAGLFSTFRPSTLDPAPVRRYDLLASALAILMDVATPAQAARILESYPHYGPGAVVVWPQQQQTPIYHNRGEWPFVTAYWLRAAAHAGNDAVADRMVRALMRGAALNLSNMENFEAGSGAPYVEEGEYSGPVVNSQRQLWSVAGYLSMVHHTIFGLRPDEDGMHVRPYLSTGLRGDLFATTNTLVLNDYPYRDRTITVVLHLPMMGGEGIYQVTDIELNGTTIAGDLLPGAMLESENRVDVWLGDPTGGGALTDRDAGDWRQIFGPRTPGISGITNVGGHPRLALNTGGETAASVTFSIYRDGEQVATDLPGTSTSWTDMSFDADSARSPCYVAELTFTESGNHSQHSQAFCWWGAGASRIQTVDATSLEHSGGELVMNHGRMHLQNWGQTGSSLTARFTAAQSGSHLVQATFGNGAGGISTGITCGHKRVRVFDESSGAEVGGGFLVMPHLGEWDRWEDSSFAEVTLEAGHAYRVVVESDANALNMSRFSHFEAYTGGLGGRGGVYEFVNVADIKLLAR